MAYRLPILALSVAADVPGPRYALLLANCTATVAAAFTQPRLVGVDASLSGEQSARGKLGIYDKSGTTNVSWIGAMTEAEPELVTRFGDGIHPLPFRMVARQSVLNRDEWPQVADWNATRRNWDIYVADRINELPTISRQLKALSLQHGRSASWRALGGGGIKMADPRQGCVAIVDQLSAPARVSVTLYLESPGA